MSFEIRKTKIVAEITEIDKDWIHFSAGRSYLMRESPDIIPNPKIGGRYLITTILEALDDKIDE